MSKKTKTKKGRLGAFISSAKGQRFFNFAYSIGAAIVIWGALFKILHLPGGNTLLSIGMGTEVLMFLLTAFDRPPKEYKWENVFPALDKKEAEEADEDQEVGVAADTVEPDLDAEMGEATISGSGQGGTIIIGGNYSGSVAAATGIGAGAGQSAQTAQPGTAVTAAAVTQATASDATADYATQVAALADDMRRLHESTEALNNVSETLLESYRAITENSSDISHTSRGYVDQLSDLNRNIQGLNTIYEIQLKSISSQLDSIDRVNRGIKDIRDMYEKSAEQSARYCEETEKMARYMQQLNKVYEKMIHAMTLNPMMAAGIPAQPQQPEADD